jgi:hypothetical protein
VVTKFLASLAAALALLGGGYWWGHTATDNAWTARQDKATTEAAMRQLRAWDRADEAVATYTQTHQDQERRYADLDRLYNNLRRRVSLDHRVLILENADSNTSDPAAVQEPGGDRPAVRISLAAVRMWNGYLTGADQAAGACGVADTATVTEAVDAETTACTQDSGLTLDDAWDNHRDNAISCAQDRQRFQALIDYLNTHPQGE